MSTTLNIGRASDPMGGIIKMSDRRSSLNAEISSFSKKPKQNDENDHPNKGQTSIKKRKKTKETISIPVP
jgi:hypothetical protein